MTATAKDEFDFVSFDDLSQDEDQFGFIPFEPMQQPFDTSRLQATNQTQQQEQPETMSPQEPPTGQKIASHPITQGLLGAAKFFTFPLDLLKIISLGGTLADVDEIEAAYEKAGKPFDREKFIEEAYRLAEYFPTQQLAEDVISEKTGIDLAPQDTSGKFARGIGELFTLTPGSLARRGIGAVAGAGTSQILKETGVPEPIADVAGAATAGIAAGGKITPKALKGEAKEAREVAEKHGLRKFAGMEKETAPKLAPVVSETFEKGLRGELSETTQKAIGNIIDQKLPIKKMRDQGVNLEQAYTKAFDITKEAAQKLPGKINIDPVRNWIKSEINRIKSKAISPSDTDKAALKLLKDEYTALSKGNPTAEQLLNQYQGFNSNVKSIYRKPEFTGSENEIKRIYSELNNKLLESTRGIPHLEKMFRFANKIFHETSKLKEVEGILGKAFKDGYDPKKLLKMIAGKRSRAYLERSLGKDSIKDLTDIARYGQVAEKKVFDYLKNPKTVGEYINKLTPLSLALLLGKKSIAIPLTLAKAPLNRIQGYLFTRDATKKNYINLLKSAGSLAALLRAAKTLDQSVKDEFGSEQSLISLAEEEQD